MLLLFIESVGEILKFTATTTHEVNVISESQVADWSSTEGDRSVVVMESLLHYLLTEKVEQGGTEQTSLTDAHCCPNDVNDFFLFDSRLQ
ncbi:hypothetical protein DPMN_068788 [Dreissena polymorpha]|uniref:Uncharacterized protein n=1 Tax=Dreissena polymorpha TaxID=45954 RepID=A0A9D3Z293_DREPO|nr:hypothetical protein DPMN_068788 [Dreissena polymorpha]